MKRCPNTDCPDIERLDVIGEHFLTVDVRSKCGSSQERVVEPEALVALESDVFARSVHHRSEDCDATVSEARNEKLPMGVD